MRGGWEVKDRPCSETTEERELTKRCSSSTPCQMLIAGNELEIDEQQPPNSLRETGLVIDRLWLERGPDQERDSASGESPSGEPLIAEELGEEPSKTPRDLCSSFCFEELVGAREHKRTPKALIDSHSPRGSERTRAMGEAKPTR